MILRRNADARIGYRQYRVIILIKNRNLHISAGPVVADGIVRQVIKNFAEHAPYTKYSRWLAQNSKGYVGVLRMRGKGLDGFLRKGL